MQKRVKSLPRLWLFTDERISNERLLAAVARLPKGSGVIFRHYSLGTAHRRALFEAVRTVSRRRRLVLLVAGGWPGGSMIGVAGRHQPGWGRRHMVPGRAMGAAGGGKKAGLLSMPVHDARDAEAARRAGADILFISPVFPTRSHPGGRALGAIGFGLLARRADGPVIALGGMSAARFRRLRALGADGWAGIDALA